MMFLVCFALFALSSSISDTRFKLCPDEKHHTKEKIENLALKGCTNKIPCALKTQNYAYLNITFRTSRVYKKIEAKLLSLVSYMVVYIYRAVGKNACIGYGLICPLKPNTSYTYSARFQVPIEAPRAWSNMKIMLLDSSDSKPIVCATIGVDIYN